MKKQSGSAISRRRFISGVPAAGVALAASRPGGTLGSVQGKLTAGDVHNYLKSLDDGWVDWSKSVDTFKAGSPATEVKGIGVAWMSYTHALKKALELGCNLFVTHEPTYFNHRDNDP